MTIDRRNFLARLATLLPAAALASQFKTPEPEPTVKHLTGDDMPVTATEILLREQEAHPMRYARVTVEDDGKGKQRAFYETSDSPDGPWQRPRILDHAQRLAVELARPNEVLLQIPWKTI